MLPPPADGWNTRVARARFSERRETTLCAGVHSWVETDPAGGLQGLGVLSGRTAELKNMGGGDLVSAKDMVCDHEEGEPALTLQQAVEPLIAQQRDINSQIAGVAKGGQGEDAVLRWGSLYGYEPLNGGQIVEEEPRKAVAAASKRAAEAGAEVKKLEADEAKLSKEEAVSPVLPRAPSEGALGHEGGGQHEEALASNEEALERTLQEKERLLDTMQTSPEAVELARERGGTVIRAKGYLRRQLGAAEAALEGLQHREARLAVDRRRDAGEVAAEQELRLEELKRARLERQHSYLQATLRKLTAGDGSRAISDAARLAEAGPKARVEALAEAGPKARVQALAEVARAGPWGGGSARRGGAWQELSVGGGGEERELTRRLRRLQGKPSSGGAYDEVGKCLLSCACLLSVSCACLLSVSRACLLSVSRCARRVLGRPCEACVCFLADAADRVGRCSRQRRSGRSGSCPSLQTPRRWLRGSSRARLGARITYLKTRPRSTARLTWSKRP